MQLLSLVFRVVRDVGKFDISCAVNETLDHLSTQLNPICRLLALLGAHHILHVSRIRVKEMAPGGRKAMH